MIVRRVEITDVPPAEELRPFANWCIDNDEDFRYGDLMLAPDTLILSWHANGWSLPDTLRLARTDGRSVHVFAVVDDMAYGLRAVPADEDS